MNVTTNIEVTTVTAGDIAITAAEGGIGYWSVIDQYNWRRWQPEPGIGEPEYPEVPEDFVFYTIVDFEDVDEGDVLRAKLPIAVTPLLIRDGIERYLNGYEPFSGNTFIGRAFDDMEDLGCMDSAEADCVIQLGAFGELVFG